MSESNKDTLRPISVADSETTTVANVDAKDVDAKDMAVSATPSSLREPSAEPQPEPEPAVPVPVADLPEKTPDETAVATTSNEEDEANFEYPKAFRLVIVTVALALSVFCMALVSAWSREPHRIDPRTDNPIGQYHSRDRHSPHY